ncbi:MAG: biopolymer transporter ExbD [Prevotellaceae bacterium]|jgi:biopolymer transport protein ExbD|nr:biopolymer transporter ExbD [Prevotellaceae bacterium]
MARKKKEMPELNGAGMSDISFLLLCFFLMTSSMDESLGINRLLPPIPEGEQEQIQIKPHNVLSVLVDGQDRLSVNAKVIDIRDLKDAAKEFILNPTRDPNKSSKKEEQINIPGRGTVTFEVTEAVISLQNVRSTSYEKYLQVQDQLTKAYNELRNEKSIELFNRKFSDLDDKQREAITQIYKQRISESPPKDTRKRK